MEGKKELTLKLQGSSACLTNDKAGISNGIVKGWHSTEVDIMWDVKFIKTGKLDISAKIANDQPNANAVVEAEVDGQKVSSPITFSGGWSKFVSMPLGTVSITKPGLKTIKIRAKKIRGAYAGDMKSVKLQGSAVEGAEEDAIPARADSIHLWYGDGGGCHFFYNQMKVTSSFPGTFFMACGFNRGYLGIQENDFAGKKIAIFSVWDSSCEGIDDPQKIPNQERTYCISGGEDVIIKRFGNEGTGCQGLLKYNWKLNETYHFLVKAAWDNSSKSMKYSGYFYLNEKSQWKHLATYGVRCSMENMTGLYSFLEDYKGSYGRHARESVFGPAWRRMPNGEWVELPKTTFTQAGKLANTDAGLKDDYHFYLRTGGRTIQTHPVNSQILVKPTGKLPQILKDVDKL